MLKRALFASVLAFAVTPACRTPKDSGRSSQVKDAPAAATAPSMGLKPVILFETSGSVDELNRKVILEAAGRAGAKAFATLGADTTLGHQMPSFALFAHALKAFDDAIAAEAAAGPLHDMIAATQGNAIVDISLLMVDEATPMPSNATTVGQSAGAMQAITKLMLLAAPRLDSETFESIADRVTKYLEAGYVAGDSPELRAANVAAYKRMVTERQDSRVPMFGKVSIQLNDKVLQFVADSRIKPAGAASKLVNNDKSVVGISVMDYVPNIGGTSEPSMMQFGVQRTYNAAGVPTRGITGSFRFGNQSGNDLRVLVQCSENCRDEAMVGQIGRRYPTIRGYFNPEKMSNYETLNESMKLIAGAFAQYNQMSVLLREVGIDFSNPAYPRVAPELSSFAIVFGDGQDSILLSKENNVEFQGFDLYNGILASKVANGLSARVRKALASSNQASAASMTKRVNALASWLNVGVNIPAAPMIAGRVVDNGKWLCLDQGLSADGSFAYAHDCHGGENQRFVLMPDRTLTLVGTGLCLDVDYSTANAGGNRLYLFPCHGKDNQRWTVTPTGQIQSDWKNEAGQNVCIDYKWNSPNPNDHVGFEVYAFACNDGVNQKMHVVGELSQLAAPTNVDEVSCCTVSRVYEYWSNLQKWRKCDYNGSDWVVYQNREVATAQADTVYEQQGPRDCSGTNYSRENIRVTKRAENCVTVPRSTCQ